MRAAFSGGGASKILGDQKAWAGMWRAQEGVPLPPRGLGVAPPENDLVKICILHFWIVLGKKMCSCHGLLGVRDIAVTSTSDIGVS